MRKISANCRQRRAEDFFKQGQIPFIGGGPGGHKYFEQGQIRARRAAKKFSAPSLNFSAPWGRITRGGAEVQNKGGKKHMMLFFESVVR